MDKKKLLKIASVLFVAAACFYIGGTIIHIENTGEGVLSSIFLALACIIMAVVTYRKSR